ncbi:efflux transporter outer membrane subunit [uncultured Dechloromonas sp.]|uniref:efflux transporter outer membrane subunit n=1 Tax=uncultured Dechloromonas sp. TaxID=171719 RepID=UPI0025EE88C6|nr:efflux transporter outer membrane subunit [uncultured Dechloromonas sp.]
MIRRTPIAAMLACLFVTGCALGPDYQRPAIDLPEVHSGSSARATGETSSLAKQNWRDVFTDPALKALIDEALTAGPDALLAAARLREAEALAGVSRAPLLPQASLSLNTSPTVRQPGERFTASYLGGAGISWEIDLWGRYRRASEAAQAELLASDEARHGMQASLIASVARYYFQLATLHETLTVTERSAKNQAEVLRLIKRLSAAGISSAAEERQQESALATTEASLPPLRRQIAETENALAILLGRAPGALRLESPPQLALPGFIPPGLPSSLLEQRPDIRQAEARLMAANARVGEARALFFPSLSLTAIFGGVSTSLADVVHGRAPAVASVGPNLLQPLFAGGQIYFNKQAAEARLEQAVISYRKTILNALGEVANGLVAYETGNDLMDIQARRVAASREAMRLADLRFRAGTTNFLEVLDAQRQLLAAETQEAQALLEKRLALVNVYLALGGGW